jgi:hypothetical protein
MHFKKDLKSKLVDGLLALLLICVLLFVLIILMVPLGRLGDAGYWLYGLITLAATAVCLYLAVWKPKSDVQQAWLGIAAGMCAWSVQEASGTLGLVALEDADGVILFVLITTFLVILWKKMGIGTRFALGFLWLNWFGHLLLKGQVYLCEAGSGFFCGLLPLTGYLAGAVILGLLVWLFGWSKNRIQRLWLASWIWLAMTTIVYVIKGW